MTKNQNETVMKMDREDLENEKKMKKKMNCSEMVLHASKHNVQKRMEDS